jgi:uncharacterized protein
MDEEIETESAREEDSNGYITVNNNPIIRAGIFQYKGSSLPGGDPNQIYNVYRPLEELTNADTLKSFAGLPILDDHEMVGGKYARGPEERGVHGATLQNIAVSGNDILAPLRIFSRTLKSLIDAGKTSLSLGYKCHFEKSCGMFEGIAYNYIQRGIRGNHLALVSQGRNGTAVLDEHDVFDHFDLALDTGETIMADEDKGADDKKTEACAIDLAAVHKFLTENAPMWKELQTLMGAVATETDVALDADTEKKDGDQAEDADDDKKDDEKKEKKEAMDSNDVTSLLDARFKSERKILTKNLMSEITARDALAKQLEPLTGTFAFDHMDADEVAAYGAEKLGLKVKKGLERVAVDGYLAGLAKNPAPGATFAMDSALGASKPKTGGLLAKRLNTAA